VDNAVSACRDCAVTNDLSSARELPNPMLGKAYTRVGKLATPRVAQLSPMRRAHRAALLLRHSGIRSVMRQLPVNRNVGGN
jgi:hypothetical protein